MGVTKGRPDKKYVINWFTGFNIGNFLLNMVIGMYMMLTRDYVKTSLGYYYSFMTLLIASETLSSIMSVVGVGIGDIIGHRKILGFSIVCLNPRQGLTPLTELEITKTN